MSALPKYHALLLQGLAHAYACTEPVSLFQSKTQPGLFPPNALGKTAAQAAYDAGWLTTVRTETRGKTTVSLVELSEAGSNFVIEQTDPKPLLEAVQQSLQQRETALQATQMTLRQQHQSVETLKSRVEQLAITIARGQISQTRVTVPDWEDQLTRYLSQRQLARPAEDCPLPELYQQAKQLAPTLSIGMFHDGLRKLQASERIALQPWTGPLHEIPEPSLALLQGHSLAFYASVRT
jgi:hypothetical protein